MTSSDNQKQAVGLRIKEARSALGLTQKELCEKAGMKLPSVRDYELGNRIPGGEAVADLVSIGINANWLLTGEGAMLLSDAKVSPARPPVKTLPVEQVAALPAAQHADFVFVPRYEVAASMGNGAAIHSELIVDYLAFREDWVRTVLCLNPKNLILINSYGDSMEPTLKSNDLLLIDRGSSDARHDDIYAFSVNGELRVKRIQFKMNGSVVIRSDNPQYDSDILTSDEVESLRIIGRVVWFGRGL